MYIIAVVVTAVAVVVCFCDQMCTFSAFSGLWSHKPAAVSWSKGYMCAGSCPNVAAGTSEHLHSTLNLDWTDRDSSPDCQPVSLLFCYAQTGYRSPLNDFQRSEGRELVPTSWNSARVSTLPGLNLEDCATRCSQTLDCRYPAFSCFHTAGCEHQ